MPSYYFDVFDGHQISCDAFGDTFSSAQDARDQGAALLPDLARDVLPGGPSHNFAAVVRDDAGEVIYRGLLLYRDLRVGDGDAHWRLAVSDLQCEITRSAELRRRTREIGRDIRNTLHDLVATLEEARATMEVSSNLLTRGPRGGDA